MTARSHFQLQVDRALARALAAALGDDAEGLEARRRLEAIERQLAVEPSPRMDALARRLGLSATHVDFVWSAVALAVEPRLLVHAEALDGAAARRGLTPALYLRLARPPADEGRALAQWLAGPNPLVDACLVACDAGPVLPAAPFTVAPRLVAHLAGDDAPERGIERFDRAALAGAQRPPSNDPGADRSDDPSSGRSDDRAGDFLDDDEQLAAIAELRRVLSDGAPVVVVVEGGRGTGRRTALARAAGAPVSAVRARLESLPVAEDLLRALRREVVLGDALPVLADLTLDSDPAASATVRAYLEAWLRGAGRVAITAAEWKLELDLDRPIVRVRWPVAATDVRRRQWPRAASALGISVDGDLERLSLQYRLGPGAMVRALRSAAMGRAAPVTLGIAEVVGGIRHNIAERLGGLARRVEVTQRWSDLVVAEDTMDHIGALIARVRHAYLVLESWQYRTKMARGQGIAALFSGPPGTGKTMVAGLIAAELGLDLYQVDLSQVVSKWIGETEKQLARIFEAAEEGHALLLFDEADALFGQRSADIKGATDRYANLEVNYLLQRIESFGGLVILTTNLDASIDKALKRRLASHIVFGAPDDEERVRLWRTLTATGAAPLATGLDFDELASDYPTMTGANIRNAAIAAAFLAAADGSAQIEQRHLGRAARAEYRSMGHVLAEIRK